MENYNWILSKVKDDLGEWIVVKLRQSGVSSEKFISETGVLYDIRQIDFTYIPEFPDYIKYLEESGRRFEEELAEYQELKVSVADHKAKIDEREYWRKLRGEIFLEYCKREAVDTTIEALNVTAEIIDVLYNQDKDFFKDK